MRIVIALVGFIAFSAFNAVMVLRSVDDNLWIAVPCGMVLGASMSLLAYRPASPGGPWLWQKK